MSVIKLEGISKSLGGKSIVDQLDLEIPDTGITIISGPSGCGKSTLLRLILGLEKPDAGEIISSITKYSVVFEDDALLPWLSAGQNVALVAEGDWECAYSALAKVGLAGCEDVIVGELSGGMKRRVAIARALVFKGECLVLDEPTIRLDDELSRRIMMCVRDVSRERPVLMVTHNQEITEEFANLIFQVEGPPLTVCEIVSNAPSRNNT